jgi:hypothetical protein
MRIAAAVISAVLVTACATSSSDSHQALNAPYLHPSARLTFPAEILGMRASDLHEFGPRDIAANYQAPGVLLTVYVYPAAMLPDPSLDAHFQEAMSAVRYKWGVETARRLELPLKDDPRGPALGAVFEVDRIPRVFGVLTVFKACSHIVKFRLSSDDTLSQERRFEILDAALDAVLPRDFARKGLESFGPDGCGVEVLESKGVSHASADGCQVFWNPQSGPLGLQTALCAAIDARVAAGAH